MQAMDTAGRAVLFAGCTVVIALLGMMLLGVDFLYGVAISASIGVLLVMLASLTLLPALLTLAGAAWRGRARRARRRAAPPRRATATAPTRGERPGGIAGGRAADVAALERVRAAPAVDDRDRRDARDARDRGAGARAAARLERRVQRPRGPDHPPRLRAARGGLRRRLQRAAAGRGQGPAAREAAGTRSLEALHAAAIARARAASVASRRSRRRGSTPPANVATITRLPALLAAGLRHHPARLAACATT